MSDNTQTLNEDPQICIACGEAIKPGDLVYIEINSGYIHAACVRESPSAPVEDVAIIHSRISFDDEQMLLNGRKWIRALLALLDEAFTVIRNQKAEIQILQNRLQNKAHKSAQACAMLCDRGGFQQWLRECHSLTDTADFERVVTKVRSILNVKSRNELDTDPAAAARFEKLKKDFELWKRQ